MSFIPLKIVSQGRDDQGRGCKIEVCERSMMYFWVANVWFNCALKSPCGYMGKRRLGHINQDWPFDFVEWKTELWRESALRYQYLALMLTVDDEQTYVERITYAPRNPERMSKLVLASSLDMLNVCWGLC